MKHVTAFVGSARRHGVTHRATRQLLDRLESSGDVRTEIVFLSDHHIGLCRGCKACFIQGEESCPLRDDRDLLIDAMRRSDGVVLCTPVLPESRRDHAYYREHGWLESDYFYPTRLGPLKRAAGAAFDWIAARRSERLLASSS
jgi:hypothetical protein